MKTVLVSVCMNRNAFLRVAAPEWSRLGVPLVIVDWSSTPSVRESLAAGAATATIVEVPGKDAFHLAKSKNLGLRAVRRLHPDAEAVLSLDCDVHVRDPGSFFARHPLDPDSFYAGGAGVPRLDHAPLGAGLPPERLEELRNRLGVFGSYYAPLARLEAVNGNNERMHGYGMYDVDLYERLAASGARRRVFAPDVLHHQPHGDRALHYREKDLDESLAANYRVFKAARPWGPAEAQEKFLVRIHGEEILL
jgi:hypothetical protein